MSGRSVQQLFDEGEFRKAAEHLNSQKFLTIPERVMRAVLEYRLGNPRIAAQQAEALLAGPLDKLDRIRTLAVVGWCQGLLSSPERSIQSLNKVIAMASETDASLEAELRAWFAQDVLSWIGIEPAFSELPRLRQSALRSGNQQALASYHITQGRIAALLGSFELADNELLRASNLLAAKPHAYTSWLLKHVRVGISSMEGHLTEAREVAEETVQLAQQYGATRVAYAQGNLAHILCAAGHFAQARRSLEQSLSNLPSSSRARFAALNTGIQIGLATGDLEFTARMVEDGLATIARVGSEWWYYRLWFELNRVRWLLHQGDDVQASEIADAVMAPVARLADKELHDRFILIRAEALARRGESLVASRLIATASSTNQRPSVPYLIELLRVAAVLTSSTDRREASRHLGSALRLASSSGQLGLKPELERTATALGMDVPNDTNAPSDALTILARLRVILAIGRHPVLLGKELLDLIRNTAVLKSARLIEERDGRRVTIDSLTGWDPGLDVGAAAEVKIFLGNRSDVTHWLITEPLPLVREQIVWNALERIADAARHPSEQHSHRNTSSFIQTGFAGVTVESGMIVSAEQTTELLHTARKLAPSNITVLITGETGTGKELYARVLHDASPRSSKPFIPFNCSAVSREMLDAQLFGYRKGAFTGATDAFPGVIRAAAGGTLFLDEIGEIALDVQPKLLRFLESGEIHPLGEPRPTHVDVRVVAATNADLETLVDAGKFREDLFYRLNVVRLQVPPLRERREEIPALAQHYLDKCSREFHKTGLRISDETMEYLILYNWAGNVRQLANEVRRMVALAESGAVLMPEHLSQPIASSRRTIPTTGRYLAPTEFVVRVDQPMSAALEHVERSMIRYALRLSGGRLEDAARRLGLSRKGLYLKRQRFGLSEAEGETRPVADVAESAPAAQQPPADRP